MLEINIVPHLFDGGYGVYLYEKDQMSGVINVAQPTVMEKLKNPETSDPPATFLLGSDMATVLFEKMWNIGFRPKDYSEAHGELKSTKYHLGDMRKIVFGLLDSRD